MIDSIYSFIFSRKFLLGILALISFLYVLSLYHRYLQQDEPWFGEQAYWLLKEGNVKLKSMPGVFNWTDDMFIYHKLFVWVGAVLILAFGWNVYVFKTFILALFILCCLLVYRFIKVHFSEMKSIGWLVLFLFLIIPELIHRSFMFRPEVMVMTLGFLSFNFLYKSLSAQKLIFFIAGGLFSGLAFLTHLNAVVFPIAGFLFLLFYRQWKGLIVYSIATGLVCSIYSVGLWSMENIETYRYQLQHWPTHQDTFGEKVEGGIFGIIWNNILRLLNEHKRYFWDQDVWAVSSLFIISLITGFKYLKKNHLRLLVYTLALMISIGVFTSGHSPRYLVYLMPFMVIITGLVMYNYKGEGKLVIKSIFMLVLLAQISFSGAAFVKIFKKNSDFAETHSNILARVEPGSTLLAPWDFIYNEIDNYQIHSFKTYEYIEDQERRQLSQEELLHLAYEKFGMDYIIIDKKRANDREFPWFKGWKIADNIYYDEIYRVEDYLILKKK